MKQENCRPCQGIESVTPRIIQNLPGQRALRYRVGNYSDFFESMLAALSRGVIPGDPSKTSDPEQQVLRHLTAREKDDPSIALLDAWAVLADVLTFYNERYASEAFLRTALQSNSLYELASQLGYTPRPGLASSVYLTFEVDDKSESVLIPAGTQAKSTPIPGTGQRSETFETTQAFIAHPSFNRIRPELTRPHNLRPDNLQNIDRLYFKGLGLRLQPNDYLAIGAKDAGNIVMKKIQSIEERRDTVQGSITVANLEPDIFNVIRYVLEVQLAFDAFFNAPEVTGFIVPDKLQRLRTQVQSSLDVAREQGLANGIAKADCQMETAILTGQLFNSSTGAGVRSIINTADTKFGGASDSSHAAENQISFALKNALTIFKNNVESIQASYNTQLVSLFPLSPPNSPENKLAYSKSIFASVSDGYVPHFYYAFPDPIENNATAGTLLGGMLLETLETDQIAYKIVCFSDKEKPESFDVARTGSVLDTLKAINFTNAASFVIFKVFRNEDSDKQLEFSGVRRIVRRQGKQSQEDLTVFVSNNDFPFDSNFEYSDASLTADIKFQLSALDGCKVDDDEVSVAQLQELRTKVAQKRVVFSESADHCTVLMTLSANGSEQAYFLRRFVRDNKPIYVRNLASNVLSGRDFNEEMSKAIAQTNAIADLIGMLNNSEPSAIAAAIEKTEAIDEKLRFDVYEKLKSIHFYRDDFIGSVQAIGDLFGTPDSIDTGVDFRNAGRGLIQNTDVSKFKEHLERFVSEAINVSQRARNCINAFDSLIGRVVDPAARRRNEVANRLSAIASRALESLGATEDAGVKTILANLFDNTLDYDKSIRTRLDNFSKLRFLSKETDLKAIIDSSIDRIIEKAFETSINISTSLSDNAKRVLSELKQDWQETKKTVEVSQQVPPNLSVDRDQSTLELVQRILSGAQRSIGGNSLGDVTKLDSSTWIQVISALRESERKVVLQFLRDYRRVETPKEGNLNVWAMRSAANLFGWNATGEASSVEQATPTRGFVSKFSDYKAELDGSAAVLDGKYTKTVGDTPIAVRTKNDTPLQAVWAKDVTLEPKHAYGISNESTLIAVSPSIVWSPKDFAVIRSTKVFCDAERLELAEVPLADLQEEFAVSGQERTGKSTDTIVLDGFVSELDIGRLVLSGISANNAVFGSPAPSRQDRNQVISSELLNAIEVKHVFPATYPKEDSKKALHGERIKTVVKLQTPLKNSFWRETVELNANVVEATHGETVGEVLGSGDARKAFQAFPLRRAPITRLSAPNPLGKIEALRVTVNNTTWEQRSQLVDGVPSDEIYELLGNRRDSSSTLQFGNGLHGTRLPSGVENVKATYRVGLGQTGNAVAGQINQLPSPPFGVKSVNNPLAGDGGSDADTVEQVRMRIPAFTSSIGRLVSASDFESFALCFAGINKAKVIHERGELKLIIAGASTSPISPQGELYRNFLSAIAQQGIEIRPDQIQPHSGLLLHLYAQVSVPRKYDWAEIQRKIEDRIFERFGYSSRQLGQSIHASDVIETIQRVREVQYVVLNRLIGLSAGDAGTATADSRIASTGIDDGSNPKPESKLQLFETVTVFNNEICYVDRAVKSTVLVERLP
ncbi:MAG: baseplate J/gp47 family protein [Planctomycetota bacterium]